MPQVARFGKKRCAWAKAGDSQLVEYHDREWGVPIHSERKHFEGLVLSGAQAGLNWLLVLRKRDGYRRAFAQFDPEKVARFTERQIWATCCQSWSDPEPDEACGSRAERTGVPQSAG